ncbi:Peptidase family M3 [Nakaseomyces glabratus]
MFSRSLSIIGRRVGNTLFRSKKTTFALIALPLFVSYRGIHLNNTYTSSIRNYSQLANTRFTNMPSLTPPQYPPSWEFKPEDILSQTKEFIANTKLFYDDLVAIDNPTIENLIVPYINHENENELLINQLTFLQHVSEDKTIRDASMEATMLLQEFEIESGSRVDLFKQFDLIWNQIKDKKDEFEDFEIWRFVEKCHKDYVRAGLNLPADKLEKVKEIKKKIADNCLKFSKNLGEQKEYILFTAEELKGVPESVIEQFEKDNDEFGIQKLKVTYKYPDIFPVLKNAQNPETRMKAFMGDQNKVPENEHLFKDTLKLRNELALVLGYDTYANYNLDIKMAKNADTVLSFVNDLIVKLQDPAKKELDILKNLKKQEFENEFNMVYDGDYYIWDHRYYDNKYLKENFNVDEEKIAEYYPLESTIDGMLKIYETLLKLKFVEVKENKKTWHDDVKQLAVWKLDTPENPEFVGWIFFDLHPRDGKYGHAANFGLSSSYISANGTRSYPITALVCNFSKSTKDKPSLLKHSEITTFFHELGHGIHDLVGNNRIGRFNGPGAVPWDFVEAPSQMLEFWTWNTKELLSLSQNYKDNAKIDTKLLESLIKTKHVNGALFALRQLHFGLFDMKVHMMSAEELDKLDIKKLWNDLREKICLISNGDQPTTGYNSFGHIMSGSYSAGYYGYMWAEVFATDMYYTKFKADRLNPEVGVKYRDIVLARGGLYEIDDNLEEFLGRKPAKDAFLEELGLH